jgi:5-methylcytosine-specific restriction endonuclease McrA
VAPSITITPVIKPRSLRLIQTTEATKRWRHRHPEENRRRCAEWRRKNKEKVNFANRRREHRIRGATGTLTYEDWVRIKDRFNYTCPSCGKREPEIKLTQDHIIPIMLGGTNNPDNIQPLCTVCNSRKNTEVVRFQPKEVVPTVPVA